MQNTLKNIEGKKKTQKNCKKFSHWLKRRVGSSLYRPRKRNSNIPSLQHSHTDRSMEEKATVMKLTIGV